MMSMLVWMNENQASGEDTAYEFLSTYPEVWENWVTVQGANLIKKAL
jgi:glycine betaine/proline transport system substrate-binding protein